MLWAEAGARDNLAGYQRSPRPRSASPAGLPRRPSKADATPWLFCRQPAARRCELFRCCGGCGSLFERTARGAQAPNDARLGCCERSPTRTIPDSDAAVEGGPWQHFAASRHERSVVRADGQTGVTPLPSDISELQARAGVVAREHAPRAGAWSGLPTRRPCHPPAPAVDLLPGAGSALRPLPAPAPRRARARAARHERGRTLPRPSHGHARPCDGV